MKPLKEVDSSWVYVERTVNPILEAFPKRFSIDARFDVPKIITPGDQIGHEEAKDLLRTEGAGHQLAYFHIPFCGTRCSFCRFFKYFANDESVLDLYTDRLVKEIEGTSKVSNGSLRPIEALYFGGGTPTSLSAENIAKLLGAVRENLPIAPECEITFETRATDLRDGKVSSAIDSGVNRLSFGVQSFNTEVRRFMSRLLSRDELLAQFSNLKSQRSVAVSVDLIYGLPNQTTEMWRQDLDDVSGLKLDGVDAYQLEDTALRMRFTNGFERLKMPSRETNARMYLTTSEVLADAGYIRDNITHWLGTADRNLYTRFSRAGVKVPANDVIAFGCGAIGKTGAKKYQIERDLGRYIERAGSGEKPVEYVEESEAKNRYLQELVAQIDTGIVDPEMILAEYGADVTKSHKTLLENYIDGGLLEIRGGKITLTEAGKFWKSNIALAFILLRP